MEQEMQARIQGTVARKTTINVNFDDTKENVRDFSVVYKGDPDEVCLPSALIVASMELAKSRQLFARDPRFLMRCIEATFAAHFRSYR